MMISTRGRYALRMMLDLAEYQGDGYVPLKDIARRQEISKKYLEQIIPILNRAELLQKTRGYQGGYRLMRAPRDYTLGDILRTTEGSLAPVACLEGEAGGEQWAERLAGKPQYAHASAARQGERPHSSRGKC